MIVTNKTAISGSTSSMDSPRTEITGSPGMSFPSRACSSRSGAVPGRTVLRRRALDPDRVPDGLDLQERQHPGWVRRRHPLLVDGEHPFDVPGGEPLQFGPVR